MTTTRRRHPQRSLRTRTRRRRWRPSSWCCSLSSMRSTPQRPALRLPVTDQSLGAAHCCRRAARACIRQASHVLRDLRRPAALPTAPPQPSPAAGRVASRHRVATAATAAATAAAATAAAAAAAAAHARRTTFATQHQRGGALVRPFRRHFARDVTEGGRTRRDPSFDKGFRRRRPAAKVPPRTPWRSPPAAAARSGPGAWPGRTGPDRVHRPCAAPRAHPPDRGLAPQRAGAT